MDIMAAYALAESYRGAAEMCGTTHKTVRRVVTEELARMSGQPLPARRVRVSNTEVVRELVGEKVTASKGRISAKRLLPVARAAGYEGSARNSPAGADSAATDSSTKTSWHLPETRGLFWTVMCKIGLESWGGWPLVAKHGLKRTECFRTHNLVVVG